jgi:8-amino-7-oxononanoate synthase
LIVDEAHAVGVYGVTGSGLIEETGIASDVLLSINPAGKALGVGGAFVAGPEWAIDYLVQRARSFIFSTAPPPAMADALQASLDVINEEPERRSRLLDLSQILRELLVKHDIATGSGSSQIVPVIIGDSETAVHIAELLQNRGYDVRAIRPPSVPSGTCRLRLSVTVNVDEHLLEEFTSVLAEAIHSPVGLAA